LLSWLLALFPCNRQHDTRRERLFHILFVQIDTKILTLKIKMFYYLVLYSSKIFRRKSHCCSFGIFYQTPTSNFDEWGFYISKTNKNLKQKRKKLILGSRNEISVVKINQMFVIIRILGNFGCFINRNLYFYWQKP
jgi:hypothetical protein